MGGFGLIVLFLYIYLWSQKIRETPHKCNHKFIEYYDIRAAEAALRALNRSDIAGKKIKLEPSRPGGTRRYLLSFIFSFVLAVHVCELVGCIDCFPFFFFSGFMNVFV